MNRRLRQNSAAAILFLAACAGGEMKSNRGPLLAVRVQTAAPFLDHMVSVHTPEGPFYIDRFEVAELSPGDFFPSMNQLPKTNITPDQARSICESQGKRLCTAFEWKNACLGTQRLRYSYGNAPVTGRCNVKSEGVIAAGRRTECANDAGAHDLIGNVMEWVADGNSRAAMGGSFLSGESADCFTSQFFSPDTTSSQIGFRCCFTKEKP